MNEFSADARLKTPDGSPSATIRVTLSTDGEVAMYEEAFRELAYGIGMTLLVEGKKYFAEAEIDSDTLEQFMTSARKKFRKPGMTEDVLEKVVSGKLRSFVHENAAEHSIAVPNH